MKAPSTTLPRLARCGSAAGAALVAYSCLAGFSWARSAERSPLGISRAAKGCVHSRRPLMGAAGFLPLLVDF